MGDKNSCLMIVEDEEKIALLIKDYLQHKFKKILIVNHGDKVLPLIEVELPSFMILDVMLPGMDGFELCKKIRLRYDFPILFLTARTLEIDRVIGFEYGADDYVIKPFSPRELLARVNAIQKRYRLGDKEERSSLDINEIQLDPNSHSVKVAGQDLKLTPTEFSILEILMRRPNFVFERSFLVKEVMGYEYEGYERNVDAHIKNIRRKIAKITAAEKIESVYGIGYKFLKNHQSEAT